MRPLHLMLLAIVLPGRSFAMPVQPRGVETFIPAPDSLASPADTVPPLRTDSLYPVKPLPPRMERASRKIDNWSASRWYRMTYAGVPLVGLGFIMKGQDTRFRRMRNDYLPTFRRRGDNYTQYAPGIVMLGLKVAGVKGRSKWGRMLVSDAFSVAIMGAVVNTVKHQANVVRPDGTNNHSFPSGHTATAFMTATMLTKEYGWRSPWIGIGAYSVAASTGIMRMANNKHWLSDVLTGAGVGILSTELGYYLADLIFRDKGLTHPDQTPRFTRDGTPSFISLYLGANIPLSGYDIDAHNEFKTSTGCTSGIEGAWFPSPYWGIGGRLTASSTSIVVNETEAADNTFDALTVAAGGYASFPLTTRWLVGGKLLTGVVHYPDLELDNLRVGRRNGFTFGTGLSMTFKAEEHYGLRFFFDYDLLPSHSRRSNEYMNKLTIGSSFLIML